MIMSKKERQKAVEETILWETKQIPAKKGNVIAFPLHHEATFQQIAISSKEEATTIEMVSSGFGRTARTSSTRMQLAA
jgi:hypothetical protein